MEAILLSDLKRAAGDACRAGRIALGHLRVVALGHLGRSRNGEQADGVVAGIPGTPLAVDDALVENVGHLNGNGSLVEAGRVCLVAPESALTAALRVHDGQGIMAFEGDVARRVPL